MFKAIRVGDEVAVIPKADSTPGEVIKLDVVKYIGPVLIVLRGGGIYFREDGRFTNRPADGSIVPVTPAHRTVLARLQTTG